LVLQNKVEQIGTVERYSEKYRDYLNNLAEYEERKDDLDWGAVGEPAPVPDSEMYETVPMTQTIPRTIEISGSDPTERYKDKLFDPNNPYKIDVVWIESMDIKDGHVVEHCSTQFDIK
jgi:hypothetical protein